MRDSATETILLLASARGKGEKSALRVGLSGRPEQWVNPSWCKVDGMKMNKFALKLIFCPPLELLREKKPREMIVRLRRQNPAYEEHVFCI